MNDNTKAPFPATILVVDDNTRNLQLISSLMGKAGYKVHAANTGEKALRYLEKRHPDIILLDVMMPDINGFEVCQQLKADETLKDIPVIFLTARTDSGDVVEGFQAGAVDYITKPFNSSEVLVRLANHLKLQKAVYDLKKQNAEKDRFFSILAHDLRGPFSGYMGLSEVLANHASELSQDEILEYSQALHEAASSVYKLLLNLLEWSRLQMGSLEYVPQRVELNKQLEETISTATRLTREKEIIFEVDIPDTLAVKADGYMLESIMRNLLTNAVKFTYPHGKISIRAWKESQDDSIDQSPETKEIFIEVVDTGMGIPDEMQERLFRIDENISRPGTHGEESTGLGLLLCRDMVARNGGELRLESEENKGSRFWFSLPAALHEMNPE
jgi:signal transduction histidine kinase